LSKDLMFPFINAPPFNPLAGECKHGCKYCWVEVLKKKFPGVKKKYSGKPRLIEADLERIKKYKHGDFAFVCDCTDLFGDWVPKAFIQKILDAIATSPATFLLLTKNPARYLEFSLPTNCVAGATIESDIDAYIPSEAPTTSNRIASMIRIPKAQKMISIEPVIQFSRGFIISLIQINPEFVAVGYNNYNTFLTEPTLSSTKKLISELERCGIKVYQKTMRERT